MTIEDIAVSDHDCPGVHLPAPPRISYIVSTYEDVRYLPCCLWSLHAQSDQDFEVIITDNSTTEEMRDRIRGMAKSIFPDCLCIATAQPTCFHSAELGVAHARGEFVCFPSDDSYYVPVFGEVMYRAAGEANVDFVICDILYDPRRGFPGYGVSEQHPRRGWFDKTGFILRRDKFTLFPDKALHYGFREGPVADCPDGLLAESLVAAGVRFIELRNVLVVHN